MEEEARLQHEHLRDDVLKKGEGLAVRRSSCACGWEATRTAGFLNGEMVSSRPQVKQSLDSNRFSALEKLLNQSEMYSKFLSEQIKDVEARTVEPAMEAAAAAAPKITAAAAKKAAAAAAKKAPAKKRGRSGAAKEEAEEAEVVAPPPIADKPELNATQVSDRMGPPSKAVKAHAEELPTIPESRPPPAPAACGHFGPSCGPRDEGGGIRLSAVVAPHLPSPQRPQTYICPCRLPLAEAAPSHVAQ